MSLSEPIKTPKFGDLVENGWASEENPTRRGYFVRAYTTTGRMNPGLHWQITDKRGKFWDLQPRAIADRLTVTPCQEGSAEDDGAAMRHTLSVQATDKSDRAEGVAALQQAGDPVAWRPIEAAPRDGTTLLACWALSDRPAFGVVHWDGADWIEGGYVVGPPTHWTDLPASPLPQQTALVEEGVEKIIAPHEPDACGASAPSEPPRSDGGEA